MKMVRADPKPDETEKMDEDDRPRDNIDQEQDDEDDADELDDFDDAGESHDLSSLFSSEGSGANDFAKICLFYQG